MVESNSGSNTRHLPIVIIGTGFGGIALAVKLQEAGIEDFSIFERAKEVGGTWRDNTYPGCACDVASNLYSYSFAPNPDWTRTHSTQPEIFEYLKKVTSDYDLYPNIRFNHELEKAEWDSENQRWRISTNQGDFTCDVLTTAAGPFGNPVIPKFPGVDAFKGESFHTFNWDHGCDIAGKNVAIIGTGATSVQVVPAIQPIVKQLTVFQRTPSHILPRLDIATSAIKRAASKHIPLFQRSIRSMWYGVYESLVGLPQFVDSRFLVPFEKVTRYHLNNQVKDKTLREKLSPNYRFGCKRPVFSSLYYPALQESNVDLVCESIKEIRENSIVDADGNEHAVDVLIYATGFRIPHQISEKLIGEGGRSLSQFFGTKPKSFMGTSFSGFPNLFMMLGPFSAAGNQSAVFMLETQADYITKAILAMRKQNLATVDVREDVLTAFSNDVEQRSQKTSWVSGGCNSYFQNPEGGNGGLWPNWSFMHRWQSRQFEVAKYNVTRRTELENV
ncbi:hypothetical protein A9Q99_01795 [Gammaproteobacteria bacterium 45_16_T64]|nr:hypothetical protein A9Q99_01795 [Gammaproteobacteria bacterium 45_16_T64]